MTLAQVWPSLYETVFDDPLDDTLYVPMAVERSHQHLPSGTFVAQSASIELGAKILTTPAGDRPPLAEFLARYPALNGWLINNPVGGKVDWPLPNQQLTLRWLKPDDLSVGHVLDDAVTVYRGTPAAFPTLEGESEAVHPLLAWWVVLYSLSMLTRYQPDQWTKMIDVNQSERATNLEFVLERAVTAVPDLVDEAIEKLA